MLVWLAGPKGFWLNEVKHMSSVFIFMGGTENGDYAVLPKLAASGRTANWGGSKTAQPGDRVLIYIQAPHSSLVASAEVLAEARKGRPGDYAYRVRIGNFSLLPQHISLDELRVRYPKWRWIAYPQGKTRVPAEYAEDLWDFAHRPSSHVQILISNAGLGLKRLRAAAASRKSHVWAAPKNAKRGETALFYVEKPISSIVARGKVLRVPSAKSGKHYQAVVGRIEMLAAPISLSELRQMFPDWAWLRNMTMFSYVTADRSKRLLTRAADPVLSANSHTPSAFGGGFGISPESNRKIEKAAITVVVKELQRLGYEVDSVEMERIGYDLNATRGRTVLHIEVKGISGSGVQFLLTRGELTRAKKDPAFRLWAVTDACTKRARVHKFTGASLIKRLVIEPYAYTAKTS